MQPHYTPSIEYLAGFFDGEGCILMHKRSTGTGTHRIQVSIKCTCRPILEHYVSRFGGTLHDALCGKNKTMYQWSASGMNGCLIFLRQVKPFLIEKREQAELACEWITYRKQFPMGGGLPARYDHDIADTFLRQIKALKYISF